MSSWLSGLFGCLEVDSIECLKVFCCGCSPCTIGKAMQQSDQSKSSSSECLKACCFPCCCIPLQRNELRATYGIEGNLCQDIGVTLCCGACSAMQMYNESKKRGPIQQQKQINQQ